MRRETATRTTTDRCLCTHTSKHLTATMTTCYTLRCCCCCCSAGDILRQSDQQPAGVTTPRCDRGNHRLASRQSDYTAGRSRAHHLATKSRWSSPLRSAAPATAYYSALALLPNNRFPPGGNRRPVGPSSTVCLQADSRKDSPFVRSSGRSLASAVLVRPCRRRRLLIGRRRKVVALRRATVLNASRRWSWHRAARSQLAMMPQIASCAVIYCAYYRRARQNSGGVC